MDDAEAAVFRLRYLACCLLTVLVRVFRLRCLAAFSPTVSGRVFQQNSVNGAFQRKIFMLVLSGIKNYVQLF